MSRDYYAILGVSRDATAAQLRKAYRRRARDLHPDRHPELDGTAFRELATAFHVLSNPRTRRLFDHGQKTANTGGTATGGTTTGGTTTDGTAPGGAPVPGREGVREEYRHAANTMLLQLVVYAVQILLVIAGFAAGCDPGTTYDSSQGPGVGRYRDPATGQWAQLPRCDLAAPDLPGLAAPDLPGITAGDRGVSGSSATTRCHYLSAPPGATDFIVVISSEHRTPPSTDITIGRHRAAIVRIPLPSPDPVAELAATAYIPQEPSTTITVRLLTYNRPDTVTFDHIARDRTRAQQLLPRILASIERSLPPPA